MYYPLPAWYAIVAYNSTVQEYVYGYTSSGSRAADRHETQPHKKLKTDHHHQRTNVTGNDGIRNRCNLHLLWRRWAEFQLPMDCNRPRSRYHYVLSFRSRASDARTMLAMCRKVPSQTKLLPVASTILPGTTTLTKRSPCIIHDDSPVYGWKSNADQ